MAKEQAGLPLRPNLTPSNSMESSTKREGTIYLAYTTRKVVATVVNSDVFVDRMKKALGGESGAVATITSVDDLVRMKPKIMTTASPPISIASSPDQSSLKASPKIPIIASFSVYLVVSFGRHVTLSRSTFNASA